MVSLLLPLVAFWVCFGAVLARAEGRRLLRDRTQAEWVLDATGMAIQGWLVPLGAAWLGRTLWAPIVPTASLRVGFIGGLLLSVVFVDLLYYANHRLLHRLWPIHRVHHGARAMDVWVSARNTAWATAFLVYPWANSLFLHVLDVPGGYLLGAAITASLDLWRHSPLHVDVPWLITPRHHAWHHSAEQHDVNFGANWTWWDRLFGTFHDPGGPPPTLGNPTGLPLWRQLVWPFGGAR